MSTSDEWERWLHLGGWGGGPGAGPDDGSGDGSGDGDRPVDAGDPIGDRTGADADDPWGSLDLDLTPLTDAQRDHLRLGAPSLLEELDAVGGEGVPGASSAPVTEVSADLAAAFQAIDEVPELDEIDEVPEVDEAGEVDEP